LARLRTQQRDALQPRRREEGLSGQAPKAAVTVGTRSSPLARRQTERVIELLEAAWPGLACRALPIVTTGDRTQRSGRPLPEIGGKGLFTAELEQSLRDGDIDAAVHSLKDLPTEQAPGVVLGAVCSRDDTRDCLVARGGLTLAELPQGAVVGTSSLRRAAQLRALRPDLEVRSIRGNVDTRIRKVREGEFDAVVLAAAGVRRLGLEDAVTEWLSVETMLPAPGQGALAIQCRADDDAVLRLLAAIDDPRARAATSAERAFLRALGAGCTAPVAAHAEARADVRRRGDAKPSDNSSQGDEGPVASRFQELRDTSSQGSMSVVLSALVASPDGRQIVRVSGEGEPEELGERLAGEAAAAGADRIVVGIRPLRGRRIAITRPRGRSARVATELERLGATVVVVPLVRVEPPEGGAALEGALRELDRYDWVVFTSANGVAAVGARAGSLKGARVAAVGPATAAAVRGLGCEPAFVPDRFAAEAIPAGLEPLAGARVLLPQADIADLALADALRARGATVDAVAAYRTVEVELAPDELAELRGADAVVLASGSAARSLASRGGAGDALLVCIGPKTAEAVREVGLPVGLVAEEATAEGIIQALTSHFGGSP
jgi:hydroxymethylbilane synthase